MQWDIELIQETLMRSYDSKDEVVMEVYRQQKLRKRTKGIVDLK